MAPAQFAVSLSFHNMGLRLCSCTHPTELLSAAACMSHCVQYGLPVYLHGACGCGRVLVCSHCHVKELHGCGSHAYRVYRHCMVPQAMRLGEKLKRLMTFIPYIQGMRSKSQLPPLLRLASTEEDTMHHGCMVQTEWYIIIIHGHIIGFQIIQSSMRLYTPSCTSPINS